MIILTTQKNILKQITAYPGFWELNGAEGDLDAAIVEFDKMPDGKTTIDEWLTSRGYKLMWEQTRRSGSNRQYSIL